MRSAGPEWNPKRCGEFAGGQVRPSRDSSRLSLNSTSSFSTSVTVEAELPGTEDWKGRCSGCAQVCQEEEEKVALKEKRHRDVTAGGDLTHV